MGSITPVTLGHPGGACTPALPLAARRSRLAVRLCFRFYQGDFSQMFTADLSFLRQVTGGCLKGSPTRVRKGQEWGGSLPCWG